MKFRKKPVVIEAEQFAPKAFILAGQTCAELPIHRDADGFFVTVPNAQGVMVARPGDWIITGVNGEKYPCPSDVFAATYEQVEDVSA